MDAKFIAIVERLVKEQGADTLIDATKCKAHLADYAQNEFKKERHLLLIAIEAGAAQAIATANDLALCKQQQIRYLKEDRFIDESAAAEAVDLLALVLRGDSQSISAANGANSQSQDVAPQNKKNAGKFFSIFGKVLLALAALWFVAYKIILSSANSAYDDGNYQKTAKLYELALNLNPIAKDAKVYYNRGLAYYNLGDYDKAIADYDQAIKIDPKHALAYYNRGNAYKNLGDYDKAIADYDQAIKIDPKHALDYYSRAVTYCHFE